MSAATVTNGKAATTAPAVPDLFPVDSFKEAARELRRPFTPAAVKFKVQATWQTGGLIVSYIDARLVVERLNLIVPHLWFDEYQPVEGGRLLCRLTVDGITRHDIGEGYQGKGLYSDALKRAAVKFGVGVSLYAVPQMMLNISDGHLKAKQVSGKQSAVLTPSGVARCREVYETWINTVGTEAFGIPLSHGDVVGAQGDAEVEDAPVLPDEPATVQPVDPAAAKQLTDQYARYEKAGHSYERLEMQVVALGGELDTSGEGSVWRHLTVEQGRAAYKWMQDEIDGAQS